MRINDVEKVTGLTQKAIRLYESKGLISISRDSNGYRNYTPEDVETLKSIKLFRSVGISLTDIRLYLFGVITVEELIYKRKAEILKESGTNSEKYRICESILNKTDIDSFSLTDILTESDDIKGDAYGELTVGIDIGTTTVSASVYDLDNKSQLEAYSIPHNSYTTIGELSEQSVAVIMEKSTKFLDHILNTYDKIISIGITGQMHGIVYVDEMGNWVSDLINWQDKRGDIVLENGETACQRIKNITGVDISTGYGIATHYYNTLKGAVPKNAVGFVSIMDLFAMKICGIKKPIIHTSVAASFGLFDVKRGCFMTDKLSMLSIDNSFLPCVTGESLVIGKCRDIPVSVPLGDNQASFLGSVRENSDTILVNIGTGSQISAVGDYIEPTKDIELRPFIEEKYLICGSALCGGFAYSMLESFFRAYTVSAGMQDASQYKIMNQLGSEAYEKGEEGLLVDTSFSGKRSDPTLRGSIINIDRSNFTPSSLVLGVLKGMCNELYELYASVPERKKRIVASGGAVKKNALLKRLLSDRFSMPVYLNSAKEEASTGAALFAAFATGKIKYGSGFSEHISYTEE